MFKKISIAIVSGVLLAQLVPTVFAANPSPAETSSFLRKNSEMLRGIARDVTDLSVMFQDVAAAIMEDFAGKAKTDLERDIPAVLAHDAAWILGGMRGYRAVPSEYGWPDNLGEQKGGSFANQLLGLRDEKNEMADKIDSDKSYDANEVKKITDKEMALFKKINDYLNNLTVDRDPSKSQSSQEVLAQAVTRDRIARNGESRGGYPAVRGLADILKSDPENTSDRQPFSKKELTDIQNKIKAIEAKKKAKEDLIEQFLNSLKVGAIKTNSSSAVATLSFGGNIKCTPVAANQVISVLKSALFVAPMNVCQQVAGLGLWGGNTTVGFHVSCIEHKKAPSAPLKSNPLKASATSSLKR